MSLLVTPDLRDACPDLAHFPGDADAVFPHHTVSTGATLRASYRCPCGREWVRFWSASDPWPLNAPAGLEAAA